MDIQPQSTKPISDDQELAKVLAGVSQETSNLGLEETAESKPASGTVPSADAKAETVSEPVVTPPKVEVEAPPVAPVAPAESLPSADSSNDLTAIKKDALLELRPLIDKLDLAPEEKFDIYLLLLRSTDDTTLIPPAHLVARDIADEPRRAQALLDIIKEIDYLSAPSQPSI
ncbi:MAG TPA: hypothetical protein VFD55_02820 [Candidatus Angelobacter sp.]|nr:hypothetical protein [Candidatus Angelobacter sp.]